MILRPMKRSLFDYFSTCKNSNFMQVSSIRCGLQVRVFRGCNCELLCYCPLSGSTEKQED